MLVLTRRVGEAFLIGEEVEIAVVDIQGDRVKIGITAPRSIGVLRKELATEAGEANAEAQSPPVDLAALAGLVKK